MPRHEPAARVPSPLFDRLTDDAPFSSAEVEPLLRLDRQAMAEAVRAELSRLLNTRRAERNYLSTPNILDYGVPDWSTYSTASNQNRMHLAQNIATAIAHFEPRLRQVTVDAAPVEGRHWTLRIRISGELNAGKHSWPLVFVAELGEKAEIRVEHERLD